MGTPAELTSPTPYGGDYTQFGNAYQLPDWVPALFSGDAGMAPLANEVNSGNTSFEDYMYDLYGDY